ncbi:Adenomatous polyposis protein 2 [Acipenser ruthenus]|uniref:Adenomatous polyposis protein 2 n=1 Tax=Acipenser ruthenus TaxID=7906 RepID=A0A444V027_ACIRT|nr:Adenomatous polyposis protein 2 [Acipenser ruthenus]
MFSESEIAQVRNCPLGNALSSPCPSLRHPWLSLNRLPSCVKCLPAGLSQRPALDLCRALLQLLPGPAECLSPGCQLAACALQLLVQLESTLKSLLSALWNLSAHSTENKVSICSVDGALGFLVSTLTYKCQSNSLAIIESGGGILRNVSSLVATREDYRQILRDHNCLQTLLQHLRSHSLTIVSNACGTLWNLSARSPKDQELLWDLGAVSMLRNLINSKHKMIAMGSAAALRNLLTNRPLKYKDAAVISPGSCMPSLYMRKQKALEAELDAKHLAETFDSIEKQQNSKHPSINKPLRHIESLSKDYASDSGCFDDDEAPNNSTSLDTSSFSAISMFLNSSNFLQVEMVFWMLSMLASRDREEMSRTLLTMSSSQESCLAMRKSGCVPLLVQILHDGAGAGPGAGGCSREARNRASAALHNMVYCQQDEGQARREMRVLHVLEQIRAHCEGGWDWLEAQRNTAALEGKNSSTALPDPVEPHICQAMCAVMKLSFEEEYRRAMNELGGLQAVADLTQLDYELYGMNSDPLNMALRRYAGMALTNLTFGDVVNKVGER